VAVLNRILWWVVKDIKCCMKPLMVEASSLQEYSLENEKLCGRD
jgi:hypothetical protein